MKYFYPFIFSLISFASTITHVQADTYPEVVFDNSLVRGIYAKSKVEYQGQSWVENLNRHLLVSDTLFFTPGNALSLQYKSAPAGDWKVDLQYNRQKLTYQVNQSDFLVFQLFVKTEHTQRGDLPKIGIKQRHNETDYLELLPYMEDFDYNTWTRVKIPIAKFKNLMTREPITAVRLLQNNASDKTHQLFIDQMEFLPKSVSQVRLSSPAILSSAVAYDKQVHLQWQLPLTPSIRYIKIYRSEDGKAFTPVGIRPISMQSCLDYVSDLNKTYYYKIAWIDYNYVESPFSAIKEVKTKRLDENELLDLVQGAHVNYFTENYDINSGMYLPFGMKDRALVSVKESGNAILSLIVGVQRERLNRQVAVGRIHSILSFLAKAQNRYGIFPTYFDGRTGLPDYRESEPTYDVLATSSLIESLLVARQFFNNDRENETNLRDKISKLYDAVQWDRLLASGYEDVLQERVSGVDADKQYATLGGVNESINAYMLAMASPTHPIPLSAYENGVKNIDQRYASAYSKMDSLAKDTLSLVRETFRLAFNPLGNEVDDSAERVSILQDTMMYGERLLFGNARGSLLEFYKPFFTIDPKILPDAEINYEDAIRDYIKVRKRRDNEIGVGSTDSDIWGFYQLTDSVGSYRVNPAIAPASMFLLPNEGRKSVLALYENNSENFFTEYGFRAWLDLRDNDVSDEYFATNQAAVAVCIENARSGLIWNLYKEIPEIKQLLSKLSANIQKNN
ncbi:glucoamylase family protein [Sphingobacterium paludis]|uniref:Glycoamylase-like domain-containing protein n=1 Tax=Sphingobacterium paludis TaxID=1476465 RepID=A0A4R7CUI2_9SPHI|nr:glucoamylase family protein [Sphingobacterium paludis]TDS11790.1 hypothetical protein B0I21_107135 [Sphingobacterium paludis]